MKIPRQLVAVSLALSTGACTTQQAVDDSIAVELDITIEDVDLNCVEDDVDEIDADSMERIASVVQTSKNGLACRVWGFYRTPVLDFEDLRDSLPEGVDEVTWTSVTLEIDEISPVISNFEGFPFGTGFAAGLAAATEDDLAAFEDSRDQPANSVMAATSTDRAGTLANIGFQVNVTPELPLDELVATVFANETTIGDPDVLAGIFNDAFASGAEDLYVLGGAYFSIPIDALPKKPSDITLQVDATISYEANAKVNLLDAAQSARN